MWPGSVDVRCGGESNSHRIVSQDNNDHVIDGFIQVSHIACNVCSVTALLLHLSILLLSPLILTSLTMYPMAPMTRKPTPTARTILVYSELVMR